jgi:hypothetical protein
MSAEERERLARLLWGAYGRHLSKTRQTTTPVDEFPWEAAGKTAQQNYGAMVEIIAAALLPPGSVVLSRDRAAWLLTVAELAHEWVNAPEDSSIGRRAEDALSWAVDEFQPGWLDPLP